MCGEVEAIPTRTKFVILMHPKELKKTKNGTGRLTHLALPNSELHVGIDFSAHSRINTLIDDPRNDCYILYPGVSSISLNSRPIHTEGKETVIFLIDSTWACSRKMLRLSRNLHPLPRLSFDTDRLSRFQIKQQPKAYCLSTIESTHCVLELLDAHGDETIGQTALETFLRPFEAMVAYQLNVIEATRRARYTERTHAPLKAKRGVR
jgi:DTW domain-containing protein YfiP